MMRISRIEVDNFKSLVDFSMDLPKFSCLIGLNGAGKSTILQFLDFLSRLVVRDGLEGWLEERGWSADELRSGLHPLPNQISFAVDFTDADQDVQGRWGGRFDFNTNACIDESVEIGGSSLITEGDEVVTIRSDGSEILSERIRFVYEGSILSQIKDDLLSPALQRVKWTIAGIQALDQLSPDHLRRRARKSDGTLGMGGRNLSALIYEMSEDERSALIDRMREVYPRLKELVPTSLQSGWKQLEIREAFSGPSAYHTPYLTTEARHINDGMLRVMAILAEIQSKHPIALFDEIENGINPELVEFVVDSLVRADKQVVVTTHSPMILNYLEDDVARESVLYIHKGSDGLTRSIPFFDIPSIGRKLKFMGPGEAFVDTDLLQLDEEINELHEAR